MWILCQVVVLLSIIVSFLEAQNPPPTSNPECNSMNTAAEHLKNTLKLVIQKDAQCKPNQHCTGVTCSWSDGGFLEVDLHHCHDPVYYHLLLKYPDVGIPTKNINVTQGHEQTLLKQKLTAVKIRVTKLERTDNIVTTTVILETCLATVCVPQKVMDNQKFCVRMQNCPGFNESAHHYTPCGINKPTSPATKQPTSTTSASTGPHTKQSSSASTGLHTKQPTSASTGPHTKQSSSATTGLHTIKQRTSTTSVSTGPHTEKPSSTTRASAGPHTKQESTSASTGPRTKQPTSASTGPHTEQPTTKSASTGHIKTKPSPQHSPSTVSPSNGTILHRKGGGGDNKKGLSTAAVIGICVAAVVAILVVVGVVVYWKKYRYRSRLRAAYYNDISMEEPLYNDFGPEIA